jgi:hypothetical protein
MKNIRENKDLYNMRLHETGVVDNDCKILRVAGGWLYIYQFNNSVGNSVSSVFVPFNEEFKEKEVYSTDSHTSFERAWVDRHGVTFTFNSNSSTDVLIHIRDELMNIQKQNNILSPFKQFILNEVTEILSKRFPDGTKGIEWITCKNDVNEGFEQAHSTDCNCLEESIELDVSPEEIEKYKKESENEILKMIRDGVKKDKVLMKFGYALGNYMQPKCCICGEKFIADKRAISCMNCADKKYNRFKNLVLQEAIDIINNKEIV